MTPADNFFLNRLKWIAFYRLLIAFLSLFLVIYWKSRIEIIEQTNIFYKILFLVFLLSILYAVFIKKQFFLKYVAFFQIFADLIIISLMTAYTGGIDSPLIFFYAFVIMEGGRLFGKNGAHIAMALAIFFLGLVFLSQYLNLFPFNNIVTQKVFYFREDFYYTFSVFALGFLLLGLLIGYLSYETTKMQKEIVEQSAKYYDLEYLKSAIINSLNSGLIVFSKDGSITYMNDNAKNIIKNLFDEVSFIKFREFFKSEIDEVSLTERVFRGEKNIYSESNESKWIGYSIVPLYDHNNLSIGVLFNFQDITSIKKMEEQIRISDKFAFMGKLSAFLAHEIRNPLASLKGGIEFLVDSLNLDQESKKVADILQKEIDRLNKIVTDFLYYTRISRPEKTNVYLKNLIDEIWFELSFLKKISSNINYIFDGDENIVVKGDANQLRQVFMNLILNAIEAMEKIGVGNLYVKTCKNNDEVVISIEDEGGGIKEEDLEKIFDPFFTTKEKGTGIGLSIVYRIIQEHGGKITVSNSKKGAVFTIRLANE